MTQRCSEPSLILYMIVFVYTRQIGITVIIRYTIRYTFQVPFIISLTLTHLQIPHTGWSVTVVSLLLRKAVVQQFYTSNRSRLRVMNSVYHSPQILPSSLEWEQ